LAFDDPDRAHSASSLGIVGLGRVSALCGEGNGVVTTSFRSIALIAVGAILVFAVTANVAGVSVSAIGLIAMIVGAIGLAVSILTPAHRERREMQRQSPRFGSRCSTRCSRVVANVAVR
jgi:hypothetical protein